MAETDSGARAAATLAGGTVLGAFGYASMGADGWHVAQRRDLGGLTEDAVAEGARLIERLAWWPDEPLTVGADPYQRPRRLAWLGSGTTPRRFLVHTIHAENDASSRPDNNYTECLVVAPAPAGRASSGPPSLQTAPGPEAPLGGGHAEGGSPFPRTTRPSQLWAVEGWATPWGAEAVADARPGQHPLETPRPGREVVELILSEPKGVLRLRCLLAAVHRVLHLRGPKVVGLVDDIIWGAVLLDTGLALLPPAAAWEVTFDLRSLPPQHRFSPSGAPGALVRLLGRSHQTSAVPPGALDLTDTCDEERLEATLRHADDQGCPQCGQWHASIDRLLRQGADVTPEQLDRQLTELRQGMQRLRGLPSSPPGGYSGGNAHDPHRGIGQPDRRADHSRGVRSSAPEVSSRGVADHLPSRIEHPDPRPVSGATGPRPPASDWAPTPAASRPSVAPSQPASAARSFSPPGRGGPITSSRVSRDLDQHGLEEALATLQDCRDHLDRGPRTLATDRLLRDAWARVRELADSELVRLTADPATGAAAMSRQPLAPDPAVPESAGSADAGHTDAGAARVPEHKLSPGAGPDPWGRRNDSW